MRYRVYSFGVHCCMEAGVEDTLTQDSVCESTTQKAAQLVADALNGAERVTGLVADLTALHAQAVADMKDCERGTNAEAYMGGQVQGLSIALTKVLEATR